MSMTDITLVKRKPHKPHWYFQWLGSCPVCGRNAGGKERRYTPKPTAWSARYEEMSSQEAYCGCLY